MRTHKSLAYVLLVAVTSLTGCGGGGDQGDSLSQQYEAALRQKSPEARALQLVKIALKQERASDLPSAERSLAAAAKACEKIPQPKQRASVLNTVVYAQAKIGFQTDANQQLMKIYQLIEQIEDREAKILIISKMVVSLGYLKPF